MAKTKDKPRVVRSVPDRGWRNLSLQLGLVNIPITLRPATGDRKSGISGRTLCPEHEQPVQMRFLCGEGTDSEHLMTKGDTVIGYETSKKSGEYVVIEEEVIESLIAERSSAAPITRFIDGEIDPIWFEKTYTVWPQTPEAEEGFNALAAVLREDGRAVAFTATLGKETRQYVLRWSQDAETLVTHLCFFDSDIRWKDLTLVSQNVASADVGDQMIQMARLVLMQSDGAFESTEIEDTYVPALTEAIAAKAAGKTITVKTEKAAPAAPKQNLMAALEASLDQARTAAKPAPKRKPAAKKTASRKKVAS